MNLPSIVHSTTYAGLANPPPPFVPVVPSIAAGRNLALLEYWHSLTKRKWLILSIALVVTVLACVVALSLPPTYRSTATVLIESGKGQILSIQEVYSDAMNGTQQREQYLTQVEILKSREVAERTVRALRLWEVPEFDPRKNESAWLNGALSAVGINPATDSKESEEDLIDATTVQFLKALTIDPVRLSQLVKISFDSSNRELAAKVANTLAAQYIEADRDARFKVSQQASTFLQDRLAALRDKLSKSEQALQAYREKHGIVSIAGSAQAPAGQQVNATTERLVAARAKRAELESAYSQLKATTDGDYSSSPIVMRDPAVMESAKDLNDVNRRLAELSRTLGPRNDRILVLESQRAAIMSVMARQRAAVVKSVTHEYEAARATEQSLERELASARGGVQSVNREEFQLASLEREAQTNRQLYDMFMSRAKETTLAGDVQASVARVVDAAVPVKKPFRPARLQIVLISAVLALLIGAMAALLIERLDDTVKGGDDAEARLKLPLLSALPAVPGADRKKMAAVLLEDPHSHFAEAIRTARTGILLSNIDQPSKILMITSTLPGEGKTTVAINLALAHAMTKRTLLIDADMRRSQVGRSLRMASGSRGLTNLVAGTSDIAACIQRFKGSDLHVMPVGDMPPNPLELLLSQRFREVLAGLSSQFEFVIIDSPPVEVVSEALVLAPLVTSTIFVVKAMSTPAPLARKSIQRLQRAGANILGVVVNQLDFKHAERYYGEYGHAGGYSYGGYEAPARVTPGRARVAAPDDGEISIAA